MGRQIRRVPLDFDWPINVIWKGYIYPFNPAQCYGCKEDDKGGSYGYSKEAQEIQKQWYAFDNFNYIYLGNGRRFNDNALAHHLEQADVDELVRHNRLMDFTHTWTPEKGWRRKKPAYHPTAEEVNEWSKQGMGHDLINEGIVVEFRCKKAGVPYTCEACNGSGKLWQSPELEEASIEWRPDDPPEGDGWQLWETVSEGSPISPVFATKEKLVDYMVKGDGWDHKWTKPQAEAMVEEEFTVSGLAVDGEFLRAEEAVEYQHNEKGK